MSRRSTSPPLFSPSLRSASALKSHIHMNSARWRWLRAFCSDRLFRPPRLRLRLLLLVRILLDSRFAPSSHHLPLASFRSCLSKAGALCLMPKCRTTTTTTLFATTTAAAAAAASCLVNNINYLVYVRAYACVCVGVCGRGTGQWASTAALYPIKAIGRRRPVICLYMQMKQCRTPYPLFVGYIQVYASLLIHCRA